jgi:uncharacterized protein YjbJ (UPF0337 family)
METTVDENRVMGTAKNIGGKAEDTIGRASGNARMQAQGMADQAVGAAQDLYGSAREGGAALESWFRRTVETQPYTAAIGALAIGWLLGRMHRPL